MGLAWSNDIGHAERLAFDTNALIYLFEAIDPYADLVAEAIERVERGFAVGVISTVVEMELLVRPLQLGDTPFIEKLELFFRNAPNLLIRPVDRTLAKAAARVRASTGMRAPDAIIAATALVERCDAIIGNDSQMAGRMPGIPYLYLGAYTA